jgi:hypothetical protein
MNQPSRPVRPVALPPLPQPLSQPMTAHPVLSPLSDTELNLRLDAVLGPDTVAVPVLRDRRAPSPAPTGHAPPPAATVVSTPAPSGAMAALTACAALLADVQVDAPADDVPGRLRALLAQRQREQGWVGELQKRQAQLMTERDTARNSGEALHEENAELTVRVAELTRQLALQRSITPPPHDDVRSAELDELRDRLAEAQAHLDEAGVVRSRIERELAAAQTARSSSERRVLELEESLAAAEQRRQEVEGQLTDQRRTTDIARLASVEAEALRRESEAHQIQIGVLSAALTEERAQRAEDRERHRIENDNRIEAMKRFEQALIGLREQLAERDRQLAAVAAAPVSLPPPVATTTAPADLAAVRDAFARIESLVVAQHGDLQALRGERDWLRETLKSRIG